MRFLRLPTTVWLIVLALHTGSPGSVVAEPLVADWPMTEGAPGGGRYSPLTDIDATNVAQLGVAWTYQFVIVKEFL